MQVNGNMRHEKELNNKIKLRPGGGKLDTNLREENIAKRPMW